MTKNIDWAALSHKLKPETAASITAFRTRHAALLKTVADLREQEKHGVNFANYQNLKNQSVVSEAKKALDTFKPTTFDLTAQLKVIDQEKVKAIALAKKTEDKVEKEFVELKELLVNIENARPIDQLLVSDVVKAFPAIDATVEKMAKRGQWRVPGYYEKFGEFQVGF